MQALSPYQQALRVAITVVVMVFVSHYFAFAEKVWMPMTALLVMQTPTGSTLQHGLQRFFVIVLSVILGSLFILHVEQRTIIDAVLILIFAAGCYFSELRATNDAALSIVFLAVLILFISIIEPVHQAHLVYGRVSDVTIGAVAGMLANLILFPAKPDKEFRQDIIPILKAYSDYVLAIENLLLREPNSEQQIEEKRILTEKSLLNYFPEWVYEPGFNIALRQGHRHFIIYVERIGQLLFSMHRAARHEFDEGARHEFAHSLRNSVAYIRDTLAGIVTILELKKLDQGIVDFEEDILELEKTFQGTATPSLEILDLSKDYSYFASFIYDLKDLRMTLFKLLEALR